MGSRHGSSDTLRDLSAEPEAGLGGPHSRGPPPGPTDRYGRPGPGAKSPPERDPYHRMDKSVEERNSRNANRGSGVGPRDRYGPGPHGEIPQVTYDPYNPKPSLPGRRGMQEREELRDVDQYSDKSAPGRGGQHLDPSSAVTKSSRSRRKLDSMFRNDSLSSDPSDCVRPPPPKPHKHKKGKKVRSSSFKF